MPDGARSDNPAVQAQLDRLNALSPGRDILGLERIRALLDRLGNPHHDLPRPIFHVAGTNGKGSTCAFLRAMLEASGQHVHVYTSPHLVRFNERIRLAGELIDDGTLAATLKEVIDAADGTGASFFEVTTAAAFLAFARTPADACVIEVGLGGRLDATNVIHPDVCGIAALGIDHESFLLSEEAGTPADPMTRIAWEKAGIAKRGAPLVTLNYSEPLNGIIAGRAADAGTIVHRDNRDWRVGRKDREMIYASEKLEITLPLPSLRGDFQTANAGLAVAMSLQQKRIPVGKSAIAAGLQKAVWPARLQLLAPGPLTEKRPDREIWLDGGHNASAGEALAAHFATLPDSSLHLIIGMLSNKNPQAIVGPLSKKLRSITVVPVPGHDAHDAQVFTGCGTEVRTAKNVPQALSEIAVNDASPVLIAGSLYLAGEVLGLNEQFPN